MVIVRNSEPFVEGINSIEWRDTPDYGPTSITPEERSYKEILIEENEGELEKALSEGKLEIIKEKILKKRIWIEFFKYAHNINAEKDVMAKARKLSEKLNADKVYYDFIKAERSSMLWDLSPAAKTPYFKGKFYFCKKPD